MRYALDAAATAVALALLSASQVGATTVRLQPAEPESKDVFVYAFEVPGTLGVPGVPADLNFDDPNVPDSALAPFGETLGAAETTPFVNPDDPEFPTTERVHTTRSLIEFDLDGVGISASEVASASFFLTGIGNLAPFAPPSEDFPVTVNLKPVLEDWDEGTVTWNTRPRDLGEVFTSQVMTGGMQVLEFDITGLVQGWLTDPSSNYGFELSQDAIAQTDMPSMFTPNDLFAVGLFASSASLDAASRPYLEIAPVPVPAAALLLGGGLAMLGGFGRLRQRA